MEGGLRRTRVQLLVVANAAGNPPDRARDAAVLAEFFGWLSGCVCSSHGGSAQGPAVGGMDGQRDWSDANRRSNVPRDRGQQVQASSCDCVLVAHGICVVLHGAPVRVWSPSSCSGFSERVGVVI